MKTLSEKQFSSDLSAHWLCESIIFFHNEKIESETDLLSREAYDVWFLHWISDRQKKFSRWVF